jgi:hypothetical protein
MPINGFAGPSFQGFQVHPNQLVSPLHDPLSAGSTCPVNFARRQTPRRSYHVYSRLCIIEFCFSFCPLLSLITTYIPLQSTASLILVVAVTRSGVLPPRISFPLTHQDVDMKVSVALSLSAILSSASAQYYRGFNVGANLPSGACRAEADWEHAFNTIKSFPGNFTSARLYAASDCSTLANAVPAAIKTGMSLLVGIWTEDNTHYEAEKQALLTAIQQHGSDWILAVSVGSEDLYRGDTDASTLASQLNDVRGMLW